MHEGDPLIRKQKPWILPVILLCEGEQLTQILINYKMQIEKMSHRVMLIINETACHTAQETGKCTYGHPILLG